MSKAPKMPPPAPPEDDVVVELKGAPNRVRKERCGDCYNWLKTTDANGGQCHRGPGPEATTMLVAGHLVPGGKDGDGPVIRTIAGFPFVHADEFCVEGFRPWVKH